MDHTESPAGDPLILPHSLLHLGPLQVEWGKSLCTRTDSTCEASWAASLTSHCPLITTFPLWRTLRMGKTSTLAGLSNTRWPCPRDTASIWNIPGAQRPCLMLHRGLGIGCASCHQEQSTPWWEPRLEALSGLLCKCSVGQTQWTIVDKKHWTLLFDI